MDDNAHLALPASSLLTGRCGIQRMQTFMWSFKRRSKPVSPPVSKLAATTLSEYVVPWLAMLDMYRSLGRKEDFEAVSYRIHFEFNLRFLPWGEICADEHSGSIEDYPHVLDRIVATWDQPECHDYLAALISDTRGALRVGFPLEVFQELLLLLFVQETRREGEQSDEPGRIPCPLFMEPVLALPEAPSVLRTPRMSPGQGG